MSLARLRAAVEMVDEVVSSLDLSAVSCEDAGRIVEVFIKGERLCHAGKALAAGRAAEGNVHLAAGHNDPSNWLAEKAAEPVGQARAELETASRLLWLNETERAFRSGELSGAQAQNIADAAAADPSAEKDLLARARTGSLRELRDECERVKAAARSKEEAEARYEAARRERHLRIWRGTDGATKGRFSLTPDAGARLLASLQPWADRYFEDARRAGSHESSDAYMADALVAVVTGGECPPPAGPDQRPGAGGALSLSEDDFAAATPAPDGASPRPVAPAGAPGRRGAGHVESAPGELRRPPPVTVICRVDLAALRRGETARGEVCEIPGVGPVPVSTARELLTDCFLKLVVTDGVDVRSVVHYGRTLTAHQRTALQFRDPYCVVPGCGRSFGLENDHIAEFALGGPTSLDNLCRLCARHHGMKTHGGYRIRGRPGAWEWVAPGKTEPAPVSRSAPAPRPRPASAGRPREHRSSQAPLRSRQASGRRYMRDRLLDRG